MQRDQLSVISKWEYGKILEEEDQPCCATRNYHLFSCLQSHVNERKKTKRRCYRTNQNTQ
jgi:hypothetical protein